MSSPTAYDAFLVKKLREILVKLFPRSHPGHLDSGESHWLHSDIEGSGKIEKRHGPDDPELLRSLSEFVQALKMSISAEKDPLIDPQDTPLNTDIDLEVNLTQADISDLNDLLDDPGHQTFPIKTLLIISSYILIAAVSIVGNVLVVQLVVRRRSQQVNTLTHALLANLATANILMATLNIPFSATRVIMSEWVFGSILCSTLPFIQVMAVYVSSFTMSIIAYDRYQVIINPLGRRMKNGTLIVLGIWALAAALSLPYALTHKVVTILTLRVVQRCQAELSVHARQILTVATFLAQYLLPLIFTTICYFFIMQRLRARSSNLGPTTPRQVAAQSRSKRKTIKMLFIVVICFAVSWAPINIYHLLTHFSIVRHNATGILLCHIIAMSSSGVNPFIYFWLNKDFRREALRWLRCFRKARSSSLDNVPDHRRPPALMRNNNTLSLRSDSAPSSPFHLNSGNHPRRKTPHHQETLFLAETSGSVPEEAEPCVQESSFIHPVDRVGPEDSSGTDPNIFHQENSSSRRDFV